jgi:branched-chain amino acid transport system permease protein
MARPSRRLVRNYSHDLRLIGTRRGQLFLVALFALYLWLPTQLDDFWASVLTLAGITAIGALGLNLLTGYTGQPSLGTAAFIGLGAFTASYCGRPEDYGGLGWSFPAYLAVAIVLGAGIGYLVGVPALRLRGNYLIIATLGLVFVAIYIWRSWEEVTGGNAGVPMPIDVEILGLNFTSLEVFGETFGRNQGYFYLVWAVVALVALLCKNLVRSRPGRAFQAVRDRDVAAEVVGVSLFRTKVSAFVLSSAIATVGGVFYGIWIQYLVPDDSSLGLNLSISYLAIIIVGGVGTIYGPVIGALLIGAMPAIIDEFAGQLPFVSESATDSGISKPALQTLLYAILIIVFLVTEPNGLAGVWRRIRDYLATWPLAKRGS